MSHCCEGGWVDVSLFLGCPGGSFTVLRLSWVEVLSIWGCGVRVDVSLLWCVRVEILSFRGWPELTKKKEISGLKIDKKES